MRRALFVTYYFPPIGGVPVVRALKLARYLPRLGWRLTVLTVGNPHEELIDDSLVAEVPDSVQVIRAREILSLDSLYKRLVARRPGNAPAGRAIRGQASGPRRLIETLVTFPDKKRFWAGPAVRAGRAYLRREGADVVLAQGYPWTALAVGERLARRAALPLVLDLRDAWTLNPKRLWATARQRRTERRIFTRADAIVLATERMQRAYGALYPELAGRLHTVTNGFDPEDLARAAAVDAPARASGKLVITYTGSLEDRVPPAAYHQSPYTFLHGLRLALDRRPALADDLQVRFVGRFGAANRDLVDGLGLAGVVEPVGFVDRRRALAHQVAADVLLLIIHTAPGAEHILTGKIFEYLAARRPILALVPPGEARELIARAGAGHVVARPDDREQIAAALLAIHDRWRRAPAAGGGLAVGPDHDEVIDRFDWRRLAGRLDRILRAAVNR